MSQQDEDDKTLLSQIKLSTAAMSEIVRLPDKGLKFLFVNNEVSAALLAWYKVESAGKEEKAAEVRKLLEKKGLVVRGSREETEMMPAIQCWND